MNKPGTTPLATSNCEVFLREVITRITSIFGRLMSLAELRDLKNGTYSYAAASHICTPDTMDRVLRQQHVDTFESWLSLSLEEQTADLSAYVLEHVRKHGDSLQHWRQQISYLALVPSTALIPEVELFRSDLELVLNIVC